ncbi:hypothetical protein MNBD_GAMMA22-2077 [hydrothermal vent metagenome]|uniref:Cupin type-2 domain-containing protein n=1 Tax=hydrothermal vent metagenome TaxID=652676 RepID=A0A3B1AU03_9ZZZZ
MTKDNKTAVTHYNTVNAYQTKDNSTIRELMHPTIHRVSNSSLAEAIVAINDQTLLHKHQNTEEIYHITNGIGLMTLGQDNFEVKAGDSICIAPDTAHCIKNIGNKPLQLLCICSPAYQHDDTELLNK